MQSDTPVTCMSKNQPQPHDHMRCRMLRDGMRFVAHGAWKANCKACSCNAYRAAGLQRCANILQHNCVASEGQSGATMWDSSNVVHAILTGKVRSPFTPRTLWQVLGHAILR